MWGISSGFPLANYLALPGSESAFGLSQGPPRARVHLLAKMDSSPERGLWEGWHHLLWGGSSSLFGPRGTFLHKCSQEVLLDLKNEKYVVCLSLIWAGLSSSFPPPLSLSWSICLQGTDFTAQPGAYLSPGSRWSRRETNTSIDWALLKFQTLSWAQTGNWGQRNIPAKVTQLVCDWILKFQVQNPPY